ncbi:MAG: aminotransferase class I/II-fold pyridoxal phosphate-dependent enzyme [Candidatus Micrarchaeia archaeon]|jgi:alanine-synthesizing transaminase
MSIKISNRIFRATYAIRDPPMMALVEKLKARGKKIIELNIGDPGGLGGAYGFHVPGHVVSAFVQALENGKNEGYASSQGDLFVRQAIAKEAKSRGFKDAQAQNVVTGQGVSEIVDFLFSAVLDKGRNVVLPRPDYPLYTAIANYYEGETRYYDLDPEKSWLPNPKQIGELIDENTAAVLIINPGNPTGSTYGKELLGQIIAEVGKAGRNRVPIISDEIYRELRFSGKHAPTAALTRTVPVVTLDGLSKNHYAPGYRMGFAVFSNFSNPDCTALLDAVTKLTGFRLSTSKAAQHALFAAVTQRKKHNAVYAAHLAKLKERTQYACKRLLGIPGITLTPPNGAFYALPKASGPWKSDKEFQRQLVEEAGVFVVPGSGFGMPESELYFRVVTLPPIEVQKQAYDRIEEFMKRHSHK